MGVKIEKLCNSCTFFEKTTDGDEPVIERRFYGYCKKLEMKVHIWNKCPAFVVKSDDS